MRYFIALLAFVLCFPAMASAQEDALHVNLRVYADRDAAIPGQTLRLAFQQNIAPGWHTYWHNPGDSGEAMRLKWTLPEGYTPSETLWPAPARVPYGPLMNFGYGDQATMLVDLPVPANAAAGTRLAISGTANILVCDEICIPETHPFNISLPVAAAATPLNQPLFAAAAQKLPRPVDWPTITELGDEDVRVRITLPDAVTNLAKTPQDIEFFPVEWGYIENPADQLAVFEPETNTLTLRQARAKARDVSKLAAAGYVMRVGDESWQVSGAINPAGPLRSTPYVMTESATPLLLALVLAFLGGMILNLMPCVFPILSMKALHLAALPGAERSHARRSGFFYGAGVLFMFLVLAVALLLLRAGGEQLGWGFQLQNPAMVAALAWLMFVVGLNLAGAFDLRIAFGGEMLLAEKHHPLLAAFLTGVLATLVATPCSAPFMATAIGAAMTKPAWQALLIFASVGAGLAFPFIALCCVPALQKILPRPGAWMETFRQALAFPMFATCVWLVWVVAQQGGAGAVGWTLSGMVALAFAIWLFDRNPVTRAGRTLAMAAGLAVAVAAFSTLGFVAPGSDDVPADEQSITVAPFTEQSLKDALEGGSPVFVNMTASWCITCLVNEKTTLHTPDLQNLFTEQDVIYLKGDWTSRDPVITKYLQGFNRSGVPLYVLYPAADPDGRRPAPIVLPQILTYDSISEALEVQTPPN